jgi:hypothetical protein
MHFKWECRIEWDLISQDTANLWRHVVVLTCDNGTYTKTVTRHTNQIDEWKPGTFA